jgi:N-acetylglucosamine-6-phosphate deacetylase
VTDRVITEAAVVTPGGVLDPGWVAISKGRITGIGAGGAPEPGEHPGSVIAAGGRWVVPGFVDLHVHGGDGCQVNSGSPAETREAVRQMARFHARHGTTGLLATAVSDTPERLLATVEGVAEHVRLGDPGGARVLGIHLEGPWLAHVKMGAQNPATLRRPSTDELKRLIEAGRGTIRLLTLAPELPGADELIAVARAAGIRVAIGHSDATFEQVVAAFEAGVSHVAHLFNAMSPLHHRRPGAVGAALLDEDVTLEVIADLVHVHPAVLSIVARLAPGRLTAVTDAIPAAGLEPGEYRLGDHDLRVEEDRAVLAAEPATLAGSLVTMDRVLRNLVEVVGLSVTEAVRATATTPAAVIGMHDFGVIRAGAVADLVVMGDGFEHEATIVGGELVPGATGPAAA